ncbi:LysR family transcriptional regulator [Acinetobacter sp. R933-2]|uniref:LysR substrate-binding domain-containing protein n=1 Tax=unclassified Acinetobacter TaxID=196816 RepID=UPI002576921F|nr:MULTISPECIES: LysR substrate-binding domain-containing protein [unclassified Acinetobacter]MDM1247649.1 LysR family transcriptional regulator [Acinetobacter sp. R933-2]MDM1769326.1 LysR family transcriptional regulator [Acinetobacter sp. 226-4]
MRIKPLPPMNSLIVFEAAVRYLSFTQAANELNVTQGAVSRQIRQLEDYLGKELFVRENRNIYLTTTGQQYYQTIYSSLLKVAEATAEIKKWQGEDQVTVVTTNAMAALWLLPKVAEFQQNECIDLRILTTENIQDLNKMDCDLALFYCKNSPANMNVTTLFAEEVFPVCSPAYLTRINASNDPQDLFRQNLLYLDESQKDWLTWPEWFAEVGYPDIKPRNKMNINNYPLLIQAAANGQGIALAWGSLLNDHLENGTLIRPVDTVLKTDANFCMLEPKDRGVIPPSVKRFKHWLLEQAVDSVGSIGIRGIQS